MTSPTPMNKGIEERIELAARDYAGTAPPHEYIAIKHGYMNGALRERQLAEKEIAEIKREYFEEGFLQGKDWDSPAVNSTEAYRAMIEKAVTFGIADYEQSKLSKGSE